MKSRDTPANNELFGSDLWHATLEKYASATHLTVRLFDADARAVLGPVHPTPLFQLFEEAGYDPGIFAECARRCIAQTEKRPPILLAQFDGLAVVGASLGLEGRIVGAAVGGYAFADFSQVSEIRRLALQSGIVFERVWEIARKQPPVPQQRLIVHGELLQVLGDALLRENYRMRQYEQAAAIVNSSDDGIVSLDCNGVITSWNNGAERLYGYSAEEAIGQPITMLIPPDRHQEEPEILARIMHGERMDHFETVRVRKDGSPFQVSLTISPLKDSAGHVIGASKIARDITERKQAEEALCASEERYRSLFTSTPMAIFVCDRNAVILDYNRRAAELWGREPVRGVEQYCGSVKLWFPDGTLLPLAQSPIAEVLRTGIPVFNTEVFIERPDGSRLPVVVNFAPLRSAEGEITGAIASFVDITERKRAEEQRTVLINELNHRVKNTLATVQSFASQALRNAKSTADAREVLDARLVALAKTHDVLTREHWTGAGLNEVMADAVTAYSGEGQAMRFHIGGPDLRLQTKSALALSMALHELATNAVKYGALANATGTVAINWRITQDDPQRFRLRWTETGGPPVEEPRRRGFGSRLVECGLAQDLGGDVRLHFERSGLICTIDAPLSEVAGADGQPS
jgi:PAS domain S-box-containing protein